jgi:hypothetical protein
MSENVDFTVKTGRNWKFTIEYFTDASETQAVDLTPYANARVGIVDQDGNPVPLTGSTTINNSTNTYATISAPKALGVITVDVPASVTKFWSVGMYYYDLIVIKDANNADPVVAGKINVERGIAQ